MRIVPLTLQMTDVLHSKEGEYSAEASELNIKNIWPERVHLLINPSGIFPYIKFFRNGELRDAEGDLMYVEYRSGDRQNKLIIFND